MEAVYGRLALGSYTKSEGREQCYFTLTGKACASAVQSTGHLAW